VNFTAEDERKDLDAYLTLEAWRNGWLLKAGSSARVAFFGD